MQYSRRRASLASRGRLSPDKFFRHYRLSQSKCGPGQPPGPHVVNIVVLRFAASGGDPRLARQHSEERRICRRRLIESGPFRPRTEQRWIGRDLAPKDGEGGRNAQGNQGALTRALECPPAVHPREPPTVSGRFAIFPAESATFTFAGNTLRQRGAPCNRKSARCCEKPVEEATSLWIVEEN